MRIASVAHPRGDAAVLSLVCLAPLVLAGCLASEGVLPAPEREEITASWIATEGNWAFFRLRLDNEGTGLLGATFHSESPMIYRVTWRLTSATGVKKGEWERLRKLDMTVEPVGDARPLELAGWAGKTHLRLRLAWEGWSPRWATFYSEAVMTHRAQQTRRAMEASVPE